MKRKSELKADISFCLSLIPFGMLTQVWGAPLKSAYIKFDVTLPNDVTILYVSANEISARTREKKA